MLDIYSCCPHEHTYGPECLARRPLSNAIFRAIWEHSPDTLDYDQAVKATNAAMDVLRPEVEPS